MAREPTEYEKKLIDMQLNLRQNNHIMEDTFKDLDNWTKDIKVKEKKLMENPDSIKSTNKGLPPIRSLPTSKKKKKVKKTRTEKETKQKSTKSVVPRDARAWDKLDVDKLCKEVDTHLSESEYTTDEEWEEEQKRVRANWEKERGNQFFKDNMLNDAINCYTSAISLEPANHVYPANRAMCLIKQEKFAAAELDCSLSLSLDPKYVKAIHRRATCRIKLGKYEDAKKDLEDLLKIEPNNKLAQVEFNQVLQLIDTRQLVFPVAKKEQDKSKKELKRILIEEINDDSSERARMEKKQEEINQRLILSSKEKKLFDFKGETEQIKTNENKMSELNELIETFGVDKSIEPITVVENKSEPIELPPKSGKKAIPDVPKNGYQFRKDWQLLSSNLDDLSAYLKKIPPKNYSSLFMNGLESDYLSKILLLFKNHFTSQPEKLYLHLKYLAEVKRFKTQLMFLSSEDKKIIKQLLDCLQSSENILKPDLEELVNIYI